MILQKLNDDLKAALLAGDSLRVSVLRGLKSVILYAEVAEGKREEGLTDEAILQIFAKEAKKRQESADLYVQGGDQARADKEIQEKAMIEAYLPKQLSEDELQALIADSIKALQPAGLQDMGKVIGAVKAKAGATADGALIARLVKERLSA
ncbi:MAG: GatB/YqeY domain-containing protein [Candidatus Saccharimonadales bacterium]